MAKSFAYLQGPSIENFKITNHIGAESFELPVYISTTGRTLREFHVDWSENEKCFLVYSEKGCGRVLVNGGWELLHEGSLVYIPTKEAVIYEPKDDTPWSTAYITFGGRLAETLAGNKICILNSKEFDFFPEAIASLWRKCGAADWDEYSQALLYYILLRFNRLMSVSEPNTDRNSLIMRKMIDSVKYVNEHFSHDLSLPQLAEMLGISEEYYCKLFKKLTGASPITYINSLRIAHACDLLSKDEGLKTDEVALMCGFRTPTYFCRVFKKETGTTPGEFRKKG